MNQRLLLSGLLALFLAGLAMTPTLRWDRAASERPFVEESRTGDAPAATHALEEGRARVARLRADVELLERRLREHRLPAPDPQAEERRAKLERAALRAKNLRESNARWQVRKLTQFVTLTADQQKAVMEFWMARCPEQLSVDQEDLDSWRKRNAGLRELLCGMVSADQMAAYDREFSDDAYMKSMFLNSLSYNLPDGMELTEAQHNTIRELARKDSMLSDQLMKFLWFRVADSELKDVALATTQFRVLVTPSLSAEQGAILDRFLNDRLEELSELAALRRKYLFDGDGN